MKKSEADWKKKLTSKEYKILRQKGTELPFTGKLLHNDETGVYKCAACGNILFDSKTKFNSGSGWPSFWEAKKGSVNYTEDNSHGMKRVEVTCKKCGSHLGHLFEDGPIDKTGKRYCINSVSLKFKKK